MAMTYKGWVDTSGNHVIMRKATSTETSCIFGQSGYGVDVKMWGALSTDYWLWDNSVSKVFHYRYTAEASPGRTHYIYARGSAMTAGNNLQGIQVNSRATTTTTIAGGTDAGEFKAGLASDTDTGTLASARGLIGDVDAKKGTITTAQAGMFVLNVGAGGTITSGAGVTAYLNNSGTVTSGIAFIADAIEGYGWTNAFVCNVSAKGTDGWLLKAGTSASPLASTSAGMAVAVYSTQSATTGTNRLSVFDLKLTGSLTTLSATALRAHAQLSSNTVGGAAYIYGGQHKFTLGGGTINHADSRICASLVQLDISSGTYTTGQLSVLWIDCGASGNPTAGDGQGNILRMSNTTTWVPNSVIFAYAEASFLLDLGGPGGNADFIVASGGTYSTADGYLLIKVHGSTMRIPYFAGVDGG